MWTGPEIAKVILEIVKVILQIITLFVTGIGIGIAIQQLRLLRFTYRDLHDWNRRKASLDAIEKALKEILGDSPLLQEKFKIMSTNDRIPLEQIQRECNADPKVQTALHKRLNYLEGLAIGVSQGVLDEVVIKNDLEHIFNRTVFQFKEYMDHRRNTGFTDAWIFLENLSSKWQDREKNLPIRRQTGIGA